ncbi:hypothetical protein ACH5RR_001699 [Cinchona calisaya]|uniref:Expansin-like EG45 domain-containing protein n=1 Tax=Cinchona calisaya TaxID=153742 RepID=A0ABD3B4S8_9GENT
METLKKILVLIGLIASLISAAYANDGLATYYNIYNPSACYGFATPTDLIAAASPTIWEGLSTCGRRYSVTCTGSTNAGTPHPCTGERVAVEIVDFCPGCQGTFDLGQDAFAAIADLDAGVILIEYDRV